MLRYSRHQSKGPDRLGRGRSARYVYRYMTYFYTKREKDEMPRAMQMGWRENARKYMSVVALLVDFNRFFPTRALLVLSAAKDLKFNHAQ